MSDRSRFRTVLLALAATLAAGIATVAGAQLLIEAFEAAAAPFRITLTSTMRYGIVAAALIGVVPATAAAVLRARRPSTDFLHRR